MDPTSPDKAILDLMAGNERFVQGRSRVQPIPFAERDQSEFVTQHPFAIVLGCSDSRVPVEMIFDQGIGKLFVIRIAGNVIGPTQLGSIEYGVEVLGATLIVILGHSHCGAIRTVLDDVERTGSSHSENLGFLVDCIQPAVAELVANSQHLDDNQIGELAIRTNVRTSMQALAARSPGLHEKLESGALKIVGAEYAMHTGKVDFFDD